MTTCRHGLTSPYRLLKKRLLRRWIEQGPEDLPNADLVKREPALDRSLGIRTG